MLLSDANTAAFIHANFVPCWETVRPAPKVTIDFGDGRVLRRTLKGNTVLYICLADGRVVDALPGVYTPAAFLSQATPVLQLLRQSADPAAIIQYHRNPKNQALAWQTAQVSVSKCAVESPLINTLSLAAPATSNPPSAYGANFDRMCAAMEDASRLPASGPSVSRALGATPQMSASAKGQLAVQKDSDTNVAYARPAVHILLGSMDHLPTTAECRDPLFKHVLHVPIDDPNLGITDVAVPGTP